MQIQISQDELELAVQQYISGMGISRPVDNVRFEVSRNPTTHSASVELASMATGPVAVETSAPTTSESTSAQKDDSPATEEGAAETDGPGEPETGTETGTETGGVGNNLFG